jgi:hypothetical protein
MSERPVILITHDDGVQARGIGVLRAAAAALGRVIVVAVTAIKARARTPSRSIDRCDTSSTMSMFTRSTARPRIALLGSHTRHSSDCILGTVRCRRRARRESRQLDRPRFPRGYAHAVELGNVSITPLALEATHHAQLSFAEGPAGD